MPAHPGRGLPHGGGADADLPDAHNLLYRYISQGRVESDRPAVSPRRLKGLLCTEPVHLKQRDHDVVINGLTLPFHNGGTEGVNTKTKLIKRQTYDRADFRLLRHRILLN